MLDSITSPSQRHLNKGIPLAAMNAYLATVRKWTPSAPVIHIDDSDVVKPDGRKFEDLGLVRDGSKSTDAKNVYVKEYHVTEAFVLTDSNHPVSIFSRINSSRVKNFTFVHDFTFAAMERGAALLGKAAFVMDRGYDDNKMFLKLDELGQDYVIRLTAKRKLFFHGKWVPATQLCNQRKGKIRTPLVYKGKSHDAYLSHVKVRITASKQEIDLILVYDITEHPMMLAANQEIRSKEDVIRVAKLYFSRWRIEEYFRCKKQMFRFEDFRVQNLISINTLNFCITLCMAFLAHISMKPKTNALKVSILQKAAPIKERVHFCYYRLAKGILEILAYAKEGVRLWLQTRHPAFRQFCLKLIL